MQVIAIEDQPDGSALVKLEMSLEEQQFFVEQGVLAVLKQAIDEQKCANTEPNEPKQANIVQQRIVHQCMVCKHEFIVGENDSTQCPSCGEQVWVNSSADFR